MKTLLMIVAMALLVIAINPHAQSAPSSIVTTFCSGSSTSGTGSGGIIPSTNILSGQSGGEQSLINVSVLIMLTMLLVVALIYMISYVIGLEQLKNILKQEIAEIAITGIIVVIFIGGFALASSATSTSAVHISGVNIGQQTFIDDCTYLSTASLNLFVPFFLINFAGYAIDLLESFKVTITPAWFGLSDTPLQGFNLFDSALTILEDVTAAFILLILLSVVTLGFIYGLFPIFLYAGIILRTLPWTRAAGGAFLGMFVGFYIIFPLMLHVLLSGYIGTLATAAVNSNPTNVQAILNGIIAGAGGGTTQLGSAVMFLTQLGTLYVGTSGGGSFGLVNGYLFFVLEPAAFTVLAIIISFMIAFDFAELAGDLLGAPSLSTSSLLKRAV